MVGAGIGDRKSTRLNSSHLVNSYAVFCLKKKIDQACKFRAMGLATPVQPEECIEVHADRHILDTDTLKHSWPPERRLGNWNIPQDSGCWPAAVITGPIGLLFVSCPAFLQAFPQCLFFDPADETGPRTGRTCQLID